MSGVRHRRRGRVQRRERGFFAYITRRLQAPLALMLSPLRRLLRQGAGTSPSCGTLSLVCRGNGSLRHLMSSLLDIRGVRTKVVGLYLSRIGIITLLGRATGAFQRVTISQGVSFILSLPSGSVPL